MHTVDEMKQDQASQGGRKRRADGWWYPWIFVGCMLVVFAMNGTMTFLAVDSFSGLETDSHYKRGLYYNENLAAADAQEALNLDTQMTLTDGWLKVRIFDQAGDPVVGLAPLAQFIRPTHQGNDSQGAMTEVLPGVYEVAADLPLKGIWDVRILAMTEGGHHLQLNQRFEVW